MADADKTLITRAEVTSIISETTKRCALVIDGMTIELGDTGLRDMSGNFVAGKIASGRVLMQRVGKVVTITLASLVLAEGINEETTFILNTDIPDGFRPRYTEVETLIQSDAEQARLVMAGTGSLAFQFGVVGVAYVGTLTYITDRAWPTTLPGVADGEPVGV